MASTSKFVVLFAALTSGVFGDRSSRMTFYSCSWILGDTVDCSSFTPMENCGTDLVTYHNQCAFSQAHCRDTTLDLLHPGKCMSIDFATTPIPAAGGAIVMDFFCTSLSHMTCGDTQNKVCGSDGRTYINECEFEKAKCTHRDLHVASFGECPSV